MKHLKKIIVITILILFASSMIIYSEIVINSVKFSLDLCINNLFPSMMSFLILSGILENYGFVEIIGYLLKPIMTNVFHLNSNCAYIIILSMLTGSPSNSKYIKQLLELKKITIEDANKILLFSHFVNPIFIIGTVGTIFLGNKKLGFIILISHYISNIIIGIFLRNKNKPKSTNVINPFEIQPNGFITTLSKTIKDTIDTLFLVFGTITSCLILSAIINKYFHFNPIFNGILEITSGLKYTSMTNFNIITKLLISSFFISFGGISIHLQVISILENKKIRYLPYFEARLLQGLISIIISYLLFIIL